MSTSAKASPVTLYLPNDRQQAFHRSPAKYRLLMGAWGAAKTTMLCQEDIQLAMEWPGSHGGIFRKTYPALRDTTQKQYLDGCPPDLIKAYRRSEGREEIVFVNGSVRIFRCLDDPLKLGSTQFDTVAVDEANEITEQIFRTLAFGRLRGAVGPRRMTISTNSVERTHWLYKFFVTEADKDKEVFHFGTKDNYRICNGWIFREAPHLVALEGDGGAVICPDGPQPHTHLNVPTDYVKRLEQMSPQEQKKYLFGQWGVIAPGKAFFPMFNEDFHTGDFQPIPHKPIVRGWDPGFQTPAAGIWQEDHDGDWVKLLELIGDGEHAESFIARMLEATNGRCPTNPVEDYCDVAGSYTHDTGPAFTLIGLKKFGLHFRYRKLPLARSLVKLQSMFGSIGPNGHPRLRIDRRCPLSIAAYAGNYYIDPRSPDGLPKKPNHPYDDIVDTDRYALATALMDSPRMPGTAYEQARQKWRVA